MSINVIGIDPSLSKTAIVIGSEHRKEKVFLITSKPLGDSVCQRMSRFEQMVAGIMRTIRENTDPLSVSRIFIENYSFGSKFAREALGEFGGILRWHLVEVDPQIVEVAPTTMKKFVTGKGNGDKDAVRMHCLKNWGYESQGNDDADAYGLWRLGLCVCGLDDAMNQAQRESVKKLCE